MKAPRIGYRMSWAANVEGEPMLVSPFTFKPYAPGRVMKSVCTATRAAHRAGRCDCGIYFLNDLQTAASLFAACQEPAYSIQVGIPRGHVAEDPAYIRRNRAENLFGDHAYRCDEFELRHIWVHPARGAGAEGLSQRYDVPCSVGVPPSKAERTRVLRPLGEHKLDYTDYPPLTAQHAQFRRALWRWNLVSTSMRADTPSISGKLTAQWLLQAAQRFDGAALEMTLWDVDAEQVQRVAQDPENPDDIDGTLLHQLLESHF